MTIQATAIATTALVTFGWSWVPPGPVAYFNRAETATIANAQVWEIAGILAPLIITQPEIAVLIGAQSWQIKTWAQHARDTGKCLRLTASGVLFGKDYSGGNCR